MRYTVDKLRGEIKWVSIHKVRHFHLPSWPYISMGQTKHRLRLTLLTIINPKFKSDV